LAYASLVAPRRLASDTLPVIRTVPKTSDLTSRSKLGGGFRLSKEEDMRDLRTAIGVCVIAVLLVACSATAKNVARDDPDYQAGYQAGLEMAEKDRVQLDCAEHGLSTRALRNLRSYRPKLEEQGKSEGFIAGFASGYHEAYRENIDSMCD
jgi:hypothetical protein